MIKDTDVEFHNQQSTERLWTETTYMAFTSPEHGLHGTLYVMARPNLGVAMSSVVIARGKRDRMHLVDFCDPQIHLEAPESYSDFTLQNGLTVKANSLTDWHFNYEHALGRCRFDLQLDGLHHPYDAKDPQENPSVASKDAANPDPRIGDAWSNGHFDLKGRITGTVEIRGEKYEIDCYEGMDRSWGPRNETPDRATCYISANFGEDLAVWLTMTVDVSADGHVTYEKVNSGFIVEHGRVTPIVAAEVEATSENLLTQKDKIGITDVNGRIINFEGTAIGTRPLGSLNPSIAAFQSLMRYEWGDKVGHGGHGKLFGLTYLADRLS